MPPLLLIFCTCLLIWIVQAVRKKYSYFSDRKVIHERPIFPLGNFWKVGISVHFIEKINSIYRQFKGKDSLCGFYIFTKPVYLILEPELIKNILVKDFYSFHDRGLYHNEHTGESPCAHCQILSLLMSSRFTCRSTISAFIFGKFS